MKWPCRPNWHERIAHKKVNHGGPSSSSCRQLLSMNWEFQGLTITRPTCCPIFRFDIRNWPALGSPSNSLNSAIHHCIVVRKAQNKHFCSNISKPALENITGAASDTHSSAPVESLSYGSTIFTDTYPVGIAVMHVTPHKPWINVTDQFCKQLASKASWITNQDCAIAPKNACAKDWARSS